MRDARARVGIVVTDDYGPFDPDWDTPVLLPALRERGVAAEAVVWHDPSVDWVSYDLLLLRSPWDYPVRLAEFHGWLRRPEVARRLVNPADLVAWNLDKSYLRELAAAGVPIVPTTFATTEEEAAAALSAARGAVVVKPAQSAGARNTGLFTADDGAALALAQVILAGGDTVLVQPEIPELSAGGERALYLIDGEFTHAIAKGALLAPGGELIGGVYQETPQDVPVTAEQIAFAQDVIGAVQRVTGCAVPLYARVDLVDSAEHGTVLLEVELAEPALNLPTAPHATPAVVDAIVARATSG